MANIPTGFGVEKVPGIPEPVHVRRPGRWLWLRQQITDMDNGDTLRVTCPNKAEAIRAYQSVGWKCKNGTWLNGSKLLCRTAPKDDNAIDDPEKGWYLYVQKQVA